MAQFEHKPGSGSLFRNDKKTDKAPDYTGTIVDHNGKPWRLGAWVKEGKKGKFFSLAISEFQKGTDQGKDQLPF
jgi:hypothetical protein